MLNSVFLLVNWKFPELDKAVLEVIIKSSPTRRFIRLGELLAGRCEEEKHLGVKIKHLGSNSRCVFEI